jgi:uroporphyrinogen-III synthase
MRALITRPKEDSAAIAERLEELGIEPVIEPLMTVEPVADPEIDLDGVQAILLTSRNGVRAFAGATGRRDIAVYAVGDSTAELARDSGFETVDSAGGDSDSLAELVRQRLKPEDGALLHAAGAPVAGDLAGVLSADGFDVRRREVYAARPVAALSVAACGLLSEGGIDLVLFFSPRTAQIFVGLVNQAGLAETCANITAVCLSRAVAHSVRPLGWREIYVAEQPNLSSMIEVAASAGADAAPEQDQAQAEAKNAVPDPPPLSAPSGSAAQGNQQPWGAGAEQVRTKSRFGLWAAGVAAVVVIAGGIYFWPQLSARFDPQAGVPVAADSVATGVLRELRGRIDRLDKAVTSLRSGPLARLEAASGKTAAELPRIATRLDAAERARAEAGRARAEAGNVAATTAALTARIDSLEKTVTQFSAVLTARLGGLDTRLSGLASGAADGVTGNAELRTENDRLKAALAAVSRRIETLEKAAAQPAPTPAPARGSALVLAIGQLRDALGKAGPFTATIESLRAVGGDDPVVSSALQVLGPLAATGVPTKDRLVATFDAAAAGAARAALVPAGSGWINRTVQRLASVVSIRREGAEVEGESAHAVLARAEARLAAGDLEGADKALSGLAEEPAAAMAAWRQDAAARIAADGVLDRLSRHAVQLLAGG